MKSGLPSSAVLLSLMLMSAGIVSGDIADPGAPKYTNSIMGDFVTPVIRPGETAEVSFKVSNPYGLNATMVNVTLVVGIYWYATQESDEPVTDDFPNPPSINDNGTQDIRELGRIEAGENESVDLSIETSKNTPHGSYFSQSTYFLRFSMTFQFEGNSTMVVLKSRGCFTESEWDSIVSFDSGEPLVNRTYLKSLGVNGLLPDSSFGIKVPIPRWPLGILIAGCVVLCSMALYYFVLDNPGKYPRLEKRLYYLRGKLSELRRKPEDRRRK
ncbi:MAG TPA: hypothetical protein VF374_02345 [Thermoplasmata archaeon]